MQFSGVRMGREPFFLPSLTLGGWMLAKASSDTLHLPSKHLLPCLSIPLLALPNPSAHPRICPSEATAATQPVDTLSRTNIPPWFVLAVV